MENKRFFPKLEFWDKIQIAINILAFLILGIAIGGKGLFWQFAPLTFMILVIFLEVLTSPQKNNFYLWATKVVTYMILTVKFSNDMGTLYWYHIVIIIISLGSFIVSKKIIKKRKVALWGQNFAVACAGILYIQAVIKYPESYNYYHILFWILNVLSYTIASVIIYSDRSKSNEDLIIPVFGIIACAIYAYVIIIVQGLL